MKKEKNLFLYGNLIFGVLLLVATICFMQTNITSYITKTIASSLFVLCGAFNLFLLYKYYDFKTNWFALFLMIGLAFAMLGDILLISNFVVGAVLFAIGHIFFAIYFCFIAKINWVDIISLVLLLTVALLLIFLYPNFQFDGMRLVVIVYAVIISTMLAKAIGNLINKKSTRNLIAFLGAFLFYFSDLMLLFYRFAGNNMIFDYFCVYTYYPAEFLLAITIFFQKKIKS